MIFFHVQELELYKVELLSKPALLAVNKMDLEDAGEKFKEMLQQLQQPQGKAQNPFDPNAILD